MSTPAENKVKFGLEKVYVAVATIDPSDNTATYASPIAVPGAKSISLDPQGELTEWYADNIAYYIVNNNQGYEGDLEVARFPDAVKAAIWGIATAGNGIRYEDSDLAAVHFALLFEFKGDSRKVRHVLYNCTATRPAISSATTEETTEPQTESTTITARPIAATVAANTVKNVVRGDCAEGDAAYESFFTAVTLPGAAG